MCIGQVHRAAECREIPGLQPKLQRQGQGCPTAWLRVWTGIRPPSQSYSLHLARHGDLGLGGTLCPTHGLPAPLCPPGLSPASSPPLLSTQHPSLLPLCHSSSAGPVPQSQVRTLLSRGRWSSGGPGCALRRGDSPQVTFLPPRVSHNPDPSSPQSSACLPHAPPLCACPAPGLHFPHQQARGKLVETDQGSSPALSPAAPPPHRAGHLALSRHRRLQFNTALRSIQATGLTAEIGGGHRWWHPSRDFQQTPSGGEWVGAADWTRGT